MGCIVDSAQQAHRDASHLRCIPQQDVGFLNPPFELIRKSHARNGLWIYQNNGALVESGKHDTMLSGLARNRSSGATGYAVDGMSEGFRKPDPKGRLDQDFANRSRVSIELAL